MRAGMPVSEFRRAACPVPISRLPARSIPGQLRSIVIANLQGLRRVRDLQPGEVRFLPLSIRRFVERYASAIEDDGGDNRRNR